MTKNSLRILRIAEVVTIIGLSRATIYAYIKDGAFPKPIKLGAQAVGWPESEIIAWVTARTAERDAA